MCIEQEIAMEQATALLQDSMMDVQLASQAAANPEALSPEHTPRVSCICADADRRAEEVSTLAR